MSRGRFGGFIKGKSLYLNSWDILKSADVPAPIELSDLIYSKAKGIWTLTSTNIFPIPIPKIEYLGGRIQGYVGGNMTFSLTSLTGGFANAPAEGDLVVVCFASAATSDLSYRISGYTQLADLYANDVHDTNLQVGYKIMTSSPDTSVTITGGTGSNYRAGAIAVHVWRNVDSSTPFDVASTTATTPNTARPNPPSITPITPGAIILAAGAGAHNTGVQTFTSSDLTNFLTVGGNDNTDITIGLGSYSWTSGAFDPAQFGFTTSDSTSFSSCAVTMALRPKRSNGM